MRFTRSFWSAYHSAERLFLKYCQNSGSVFAHLDALHETHAHTRLENQCAPPLATGVKWSSCSCSEVKPQ